MYKASAKALGLGLSAAVLLSTVAPVMADTITVSDNGSESENSAKVTVARKINIAQKNSADVSNSDAANANTGGNSAVGNTGGDVLIDTGDASTDVALSNKANVSSAEIACCEPTDMDVAVSGNGEGSENKVTLNFENTINILDEKYLNIKNNVEASANTGDNYAFGNNGDVRIITGDASVGVDIDNEGNFNSIVLGSVVPETPGNPNNPNNPENPKPGPKPNLPKPGSVLGEATDLPMTGFNLYLLLGISLALVSAGVVLRRSGSALNNLQAKI